VVIVTASTWVTVSALSDPVRRALYEHVRRQDHPVSREEAAEAVNISRNLTAFHLDKLVDAGLLRSRYESPPGPRGRGRTPKVYEATGAGLSLTVPPRRYELVGSILADAVAADPADARAAALIRARDLGRELGSDRPPGTDGPPSTDGPGGAWMAAVDAALTDLGFEPRPDGPSAIVMDNCPFHQLAQHQPELICGLNVAFVTGLLEGLDADARAVLEPRPGHCCVRLISA
jgi:predicted ArsR family transcriptional regulator